MYRTNWIDAKKEANKVNRLFFRLPANSFKIRINRLEKECFAQVTKENDVIILQLNKSFKNYNLFRDIVAHEMIHVWQYVNGYIDEHHGKTFFSWKHAMSNFGYNIEATYEL